MSKSIASFAARPALIAGVLLATMGLSVHASATDAAAPTSPTGSGERRWRISAESDVVRLALGSLSFHLMVRPPFAPRLRVGIGRVGGPLPKVFHTLFDPNEGWDTREQGGVVQAFYHFSDQRSTPYIGGYARFEQWEWRRPELAGSASGSQLFLMPAVGYRWFPTSSGLFISPWVGLGVSVWNSGPGKLGEHTYEPLRWFPIAAIHVGYEL